MKGTTMTNESPAFPAPPEEAVNWACIGFRHDFGLIPNDEAQRVRAEGLAWLSAWRTGFEAGDEAPGDHGLGGDAEPKARTLDAACVSFDPAFRTRPFHEASKIRAGGVEWLRAWRGVLIPDPITRAIASVDRASDIAAELLAMVDGDPGRIDAIQPDARRPDFSDPRLVSLTAATDRFAEVFGEGIAEGLRAMQRFPAPNYTISKFAEEAGEAHKELIHLAESRSTFDKVRGEMVQTIGMMFRLWVEGDQVHGLPPLFDLTAEPLEAPDPRVAALVRCAKADVPTDVQELLVRGDPMRGIPADIVGIILRVAKPSAGAV
jgi:hypothetical protein